MKDALPDDHATALRAVWENFQQLRESSKYTGQAPLSWGKLNALYNFLGIGLEPTLRFLAEAKNFASFEHWVKQHGTPTTDISTQAAECLPAIFTEEELTQWEETGYIVVRNAITTTDCQATAKLIYETLSADPENPASWYLPHPLKQGIMVQLFQHEQLDRNRHSARIRRAFEQLWQRADLLVSKDRVSFNPPETADYQFPGPNLHWDTSLKRPIPFGLQGLLYLTDTTVNQGAFTVIPGFHRRIERWLEQLPTGTDPRNPALLAGLQRTPVAAKAGDMIIWHQCLPHGSSPNTSATPRIVQYINYQPVDLPARQEWL